MADSDEQIPRQPKRDSPQRRDDVVSIGETEPDGPVTDAATSFWTTVRDRFRSPWTGPLILAALAWNWRLVGTLCFGGDTFLHRLKAADDLGMTQRAYETWGWPIAIAVGWICFLPVLSCGAAWMSGRWETAIAYWRRKGLGETMLSKEQAVAEGVRIRKWDHEVRTRYERALAERDEYLQRAMKAESAEAEARGEGARDAASLRAEIATQRKKTEALGDSAAGWRTAAVDIAARVVRMVRRRDSKQEAQHGWAVWKVAAVEQLQLHGPLQAGARKSTEGDPTWERGTATLAEIELLCAFDLLSRRDGDRLVLTEEGFQVAMELIRRGGVQAP